MEGRRIYVKHSSYSDELYHYGVSGMEWHKRLYQYEDGSLTPLGRIHYGVGKLKAKKSEKSEKSETERTSKNSSQKTENGRHGDGNEPFQHVKKQPTSKYADLTEEEIKQRMYRLQLEKQLENLEKQSTENTLGRRIGNKVLSVAEDIAISTARDVGKKVVSHYTDKALNKVFGDSIDLEETKKWAENFGLYDKTATEIGNIFKERTTVNNVYKQETGKNLPKGFVYPDQMRQMKSQNKSENKSETGRKYNISGYERSGLGSKISGFVDNNKSKIRSMRSSGMTIEEIADKLNISTSTVEKYI